MKRNPETVRNILLNPSQYVGVPLEDKRISYHIRLLADAGLLQGEYIYGDGMTMWTELKITWEGHELLSSVMNDSVWEEVKNIIESNGFILDDVPLSVIKELGNKTILDKLRRG